MFDDDLIQLSGDKRLGKVEKRELLEKDIEAAVCRYAVKNYDMTAEKFTSPARRSVPDRLFSLKNGMVFFVEFKAPGKKPTEKQKLDHELRRSRGFTVLVIDDIEDGKRQIDQAHLNLAWRR